MNAKDSADVDGYVVQVYNNHACMLSLKVKLHSYICENI